MVKFIHSRNGVGITSDKIVYIHINLLARLLDESIPSMIEYLEEYHHHYEANTMLDTETALDIINNLSIHKTITWSLYPNRAKELSKLCGIYGFVTFMYYLSGYQEGLEVHPYNMIHMVEAIEVFKKFLDKELKNFKVEEQE